MSRDRSNVSDRLDFEEPRDVSPQARYHFQPDDDNVPDLFFGTEEEACAAQQGWRIARGFKPYSGEQETK
jgi:hypothetical protein